MTQENFECEIKIVGAYSFGRKYGQHGMEIGYYVKGPLGGVSILQFTPWCVPKNKSINYASALNHNKFMAPELVSVNIHSKTPMHENQTPTEDCKLTGGDCYCDSSFLYAADWTEGFIHGGSEWLFSKMKDYYAQQFENGPPVNLIPRPQIPPKDSK